MEKKLTIYTIGHSNYSTEELLAKLKSFSIDTVVDVRSFPVSKHNPHFHKNSLATTLPAKGISYHFFGDSLGGIRRDPALMSGDKTDYLKVRSLESFQKGINALIALAQTSRVVLMCGEANPFGCHRHLLISQELMSRGVEVFHILASGEAHSAKNAVQELQFALF